MVPAQNPPKTLIEWSVLILNTADPTLKVCYQLPLVRGYVERLLRGVRLGAAHKTRRERIQDRTAKVYWTSRAERATPTSRSASTGIHCQEHGQSWEGGETEEPTCHASCTCQY